MMPLARKNLHECEYHLSNLIKSKHFEELEINFTAFVRSAVNVTWVLVKQFKKHPKFIEWYGDPDNSETTKKGTKIYEMKNDDLCKFFKKLRNQIEKEGINGLIGSTSIQSLDTATDMQDRPVGSSIAITGRGIYYIINQGTSQEDHIPAKTTAKLTTHVFIENPPKLHLNEKIGDPNLAELSKMYYKYLKNLVEDWMGIHLSQSQNNKI